jgi:hypothetical protein
MLLSSCITETELDLADAIPSGNAVEESGNTSETSPPNDSIAPPDDTAREDDQACEEIPSRITMNVDTMESITFMYVNMGKKKLITRTSDMMLISDFINTIDMVLIPNGDVKNPSQQSYAGGQALRIYIHELEGITHSITYHSSGDGVEGYFTTDNPYDSFTAASAEYGYDGELFLVKPERLVYRGCGSDLFKIWFDLDYDVF